MGWGQVLKFPTDLWMEPGKGPGPSLPKSKGMRVAAHNSTDALGRPGSTATQIGGRVACTMVLVLGTAVSAVGEVRADLPAAAVGSRTPAVQSLPAGVGFVGMIAATAHRPEGWAWGRVVHGAVMLLQGPIGPAANDRTVRLSVPRYVEESRHARLLHDQPGRHADSAARAKPGPESGWIRWIPASDSRLACRGDASPGVGLPRPALPVPRLEGTIGVATLGRGPRDSCRARPRRVRLRSPIGPEARSDIRPSVQR